MTLKSLHLSCSQSLTARFISKVLLIKSTCLRSKQTAVPSKLTASSSIKTNRSSAAKQSKIALRGHVARTVVNSVSMVTIWMKKTAVSASSVRFKAAQSAQVRLSALSVPVTSFRCKRTDRARATLNLSSLT